MLKTIDDNIYAIRNKNEIYEIMITTFSSESVFNLKRDLFIKALNELIKVDYLKKLK